MAVSGNPFDVPEFRTELKSVLDEKLTPLVALVTKHENAYQRSKGVLWVLAGIWGLMEVILHNAGDLVHWIFPATAIRR